MTVGIVGTLWLAGVPLNPFAVRVKEDPYMVRIPINAQPIPAYTRVERSQMINPTTGGLMFQKVPPNSMIGMSVVGIDQQGSQAEGRIENVKRVGDEVVFVLSDNREIRQSQTFELGGALLNINSIIGRVVKRDKRAGLGFQESTFFPQGTPEGIAGATPIGMRAITLDATKLTGVHALGAGDQIDLMASFRVDGSTDGPNSLNIPGQAASGKQAEISEPHLLAQNAIVLKPVYVRNEASTSSSLTQGKRIQNVPKYEVAIAVKPDDLIPLQRALNQSLAITCIAHSMKPVGDPTTDATATDNAETVMVPVTVHPVLAYNVVTREAFVSTATRALKFEALPRSQVTEMDIITSLNEVLGAVARHDIPAGRFLKRGDLLNGPPSQETTTPRPQISTKASPSGALNSLHNDQKFVTLVQPPATDSAPTATAVGDRPAISRFVPPGMKSFSIPWNRLFGAEHLQIGDSIDLFASYPLQKLRTVVETTEKPDGTIIRREYETLDFQSTERTLEETFGQRGEPWFVATHAIVIGPVGFPAPASALRELANPDSDKFGRGTSDRSGVKLVGPPVIVAVADQDAENFAAALVTNEALFSVAIHSESSTVRDGLKEIALCPVSIQAYELFDESVWNNNRRRIVTRLVDESDTRFANALAAKDIEAYYGRTLLKAKSRWDFFTDSDFMAPDVTPGVAAGVRAGYTVAMIDEAMIEGLAQFKTEDQVTILLRNVTRLPDNVIYFGFSRDFPQARVVVRDMRIIRRSVEGKIAIELPDCEAAALQSVLAYVGQASVKNASQATPQRANRQSSSDGSDTPSSQMPSLVAIAQPRAAAPSNMIQVGQPVSAVQSFDPLSGIKLMEFIVGGRRSVYAFDGLPATEDGAVPCP